MTKREIMRARKQTDEFSIIGVDLALTGGLGLCCLPVLSWQKGYADFKLIKPPAPLVDFEERIDFLVTHFIDFYMSRAKPVHSIWVENYVAFGQASFNIQKLAEVGGVLKYEFWKLTGFGFQTAMLSSARKLLLGKLPQGKGKAKAAVFDTAKQLFPHHTISKDEADAYVSANWGLYKSGFNFSGQTPVK